VVQFNEQLEEEAAEAGGAGSRVSAASLELQVCVLRVQGDEPLLPR
jgi:hypothetical protein